MNQTEYNKEHNKLMLKESIKRSIKSKLVYINDVLNKSDDKKRIRKNLEFEKMSVLSDKKALKLWKDDPELIKLIEQELSLSENIIEISEDKLNELGETEKEKQETISANKYSLEDMENAMNEASDPKTGINLAFLKGNAMILINLGNEILIDMEDKEGAMEIWANGSFENDAERWLAINQEIYNAPWADAELRSLIQEDNKILNKQLEKVKEYKMLKNQRSNNTGEHTDEQEIDGDISIEEPTGEEIDEIAEPDEQETGVMEEPDEHETGVMEEPDDWER